MRLTSWGVASGCGEDSSWGKRATPRESGCYVVLVLRSTMQGFWALTGPIHCKRWSCWCSQPLLTSRQVHIQKAQHPCQYFFWVLPYCESHKV